MWRNMTLRWRPADQWGAGSAAGRQVLWGPMICISVEVISAHDLKIGAKEIVRLLLVTQCRGVFGACSVPLMSARGWVCGLTRL